MLGLILFFLFLAILSSIINRPHFLTPRQYANLGRRERHNYKAIKCTICGDKVFYGDYSHVNRDNYSIYTCEHPHCS